MLRSADKFLRKRWHCTGVKIPKIGKRGFRGQKLPFSITSEKGALSRKIPIFLVEACREMGTFRLKAPFSEATGNGSFFDPETLFSRFWGFCRRFRKTSSQNRSPSLLPLCKSRTAKLRIWTLWIWCCSVLHGCDSRCSIERNHAYFWSNV